MSHTPRTFDTFDRKKTLLNNRVDPIFVAQHL